jgi:hypothetical protein
MVLLWRIRYLDTREKLFKNRDLFLDTSTLDPAMQVAVELCNQLRESGDRRGILRYRQLFREGCSAVEEHRELSRRCGFVSPVSVRDYFEDENGNELTTGQLAVILTGNPSACALPTGTKQYDIDWLLSDKRPITLDEVSLSQEHLIVLGYFTRDLREMLSAGFYKDGPGTLSYSSGSAPIIQTASTDEEIRSFVTIFRRLYMADEPANFIKAVKVFCDVISGNPLAAWVRGVAEDYEKELKGKPDFNLIIGREQWAFSRKRLIDVFLYTRYAHQPDDRRARQYQECLASVGGRSDLLTWLFLTELWRCALHIRNAGIIVADFYDRYCGHREVSPAVLGSVSNDHPGIGSLEKRAVRRARLFQEKTEELAKMMWQQNGCPESGFTQFLQEARQQLERAFSETDAGRNKPV